jgi:hypothetical protein
VGKFWGSKHNAKQKKPQLLDMFIVYKTTSTFLFNLFMKNFDGYLGQKDLSGKKMPAGIMLGTTALKFKPTF